MEANLQQTPASPKKNQTVIIAAVIDDVTENIDGHTFISQLIGKDSAILISADRKQEEG